MILEVIISLRNEMTLILMIMILLLLLLLEALDG